jgi:hypothetical protein
VTNSYRDASRKNGRAHSGNMRFRIIFHSLRNKVTNDLICTYVTFCMGINFKRAKTCIVNREKYFYVNNYKYEDKANV